jgi:uncharacterized protein YoxC
MKEIIMEGLPKNSPSRPPASLTRKVTILNEWLKVIATAVLVFVGICFGIVLLHVNKTLTKLDTTVDNFNSEIAKIDTTRKTIDDLLVQTTVLIVDADDAATKESKTIDDINTKLTATLDHVDEAVQALTKNQNELTLHTVQTLDATTAAISGVQPVLDNLKIVTDSANDDLQMVSKRLADPAITQTLANVSSMTTSGASILKDGADEVHSLIHPAKKVGFWAGLNATVMYIKRFIPPLF